MNKCNPKRRRGTSATEVIVAATLLLSMMGLVVPMTIRAGRIMRDARHYQLAMNELSNQFEYLSCLSDAERSTALIELKVSEQARQRLPNANLEASLSTRDDGVRLTLSLNWDRGVGAVPIQITGWLSSSVADSATAPVPSDSTKEDSNETT